MKIFIVTAFPKMIEASLSESMFQKAADEDVVSYHIWDLRDFARNKHNQVDDAPFGGGAGMVMKPEPFFRAHDRLKKVLGKSELKVIFPSPQGIIFDNGLSKKLAAEKELIFFCGHYKGVDERVIKKLVTDEISVGDFVVTGGELPTLLIIDAVIRHIPGVLHSYESAESDSFSDNLLEGPLYTRPQRYRRIGVPDVLLSGNHKKIAEWRKKQRIIRTLERRADLLNSEMETKDVGGRNG